MKRWQGFARWGRTAMAALVLGGSLMVVGVPSASARDFDDRGRCEEQVERAQARLNRAVWRFGYYSRQAEHERHELAEARQRCWAQSHAYQWRRDRDGDRDRR